MTDDPLRTITHLITADDVPADERARRLLPLMYEQLRSEANRLMGGERRDHTLQPTALVHEAYLKICGERDLPWQNRAHFFAAAAEAMRRVLLDHAKARGRVRRGGGRRPIPLDLNDVADSWDIEEIVSLDDAVRRLGERDSTMGEIVQLRFYAGLTIAETAELLELSAATVKRRWEYARTWLFHEIAGEKDDAAAESGPSV